MTWRPDYTDLAGLKAQLRVTDTDDDTAMSLAITAASRAIDKEANRQFGVLSAAAPRYYTAGGEHIEGRCALPIDDLMDTSDLAVAVDTTGMGTFDQALTYGTDFDLWPWNAQADGLPWTHAVLRPTGAWFGWGFGWARGVRVTAKFGWSAVPESVTQSCLIQAARFFTRRDSPYGIAGSPDVGSEMRLLARLDPDVALLLSSVKRHSVVAG